MQTDERHRIHDLVRLQGVAEMPKAALQCVEATDESLAGTAAA